MNASEQTVSTGEQSPPPASRRDWVERAWVLFCSVKLMTVLMTLLALAMAAGTFLNPQEDSFEQIERAFAGRPAVLWLYRTFELYAPFKSWWFTSIVLLLALNNLASSIERLPRIFWVVRHPERRLSDRIWRSVGQKKYFDAGLAHLDVIRAHQELSAAGYRVSDAETADGQTFIFAERGAWTRFGVWVVHIALLIICLGGIVGRLFSFEGTMDLPEHGGRSDHIRERMHDGTIIRRPLPGFQVQCNDFILDKFNDGSARRFASQVAVLDTSGETVLHRKQIEVNDPLEWAGMRFYQATYQERPDLSHALIRVTDRQNQSTQEFRATPQTPMSLDQGVTRFTVLDYNPDFGDLGPAVQVQRDEKRPGEGGTVPADAEPKVDSQTFWVFKNAPEFDLKYRGDRWGLRFEGLEPLFVTGIQVAYDPGVPWIYLGCFLMFAGLFVAFWSSHRRIWIRIDPTGVSIAGATHRNKEAFRTEFGRILHRLGASAPGTTEGDA